jgi:hypothetical protein
MAKKRHRRGARTKPPVIDKKKQIALDDLAAGKKLAFHHTHIIGLAIGPSIFLLTLRDKLTEKTGGLIKYYIFFLFGVATLGSILYYGFPTPTPYVGDTKAYKRRAVFLLALAIFGNLAVWVPIIYAYGAFDWLIERLPARQTLGTNFYIGVAFVAGAVTSGVLGNLAYDILKYYARKVREKQKG